jgi:hypothetical protein
MIKPYMRISYANVVNRLVTGVPTIKQRRRIRSVSLLKGCSGC